MTAPAAKKHDEAAFGVIYGSVSVMAVIMALDASLEDPGRIALVTGGLGLLLSAIKYLAH